jgi:hypothetical protein
MSSRTIIRRAGIAVIVLLVVLQFIPLGRDHSNPAVNAEPGWDTPTTRALAKRACFDCHSNETEWPWYSHVAPVSWLVQDDVHEGRRKLNFSEWNRPQKNAEEAAEEVQKGKMPLWFYVPLHPQAKLSATEKSALINGLQATFGGQAQRDNSPLENRKKTEGHGEH